MSSDSLLGAYDEEPYLTLGALALGTLLVALGLTLSQLGLGSLFFRQGFFSAGLLVEFLRGLLVLIAGLLSLLVGWALLFRGLTTLIAVGVADGRLMSEG
jgi:hypothetical protein